MNAIGQRTGVVTSGTAFATAPIWQWGYDSLGQVITADSNVPTSDRAYAYDAMGNRKKSANSLTLPGTDNYTSNSLNQYTAVDAVVPGYDDDGNATAYPLPVSPTTNSTLVWDAENRLVSSTVGSTTTTYLYDAQFRRIAKVTGASSVRYVYDGWNCIAEYSGASLAKTNLWGPDLSGTMQGAGGVGGLLAVHSGGVSHFPTYDGNGNVSEYLTSTGTVAAHFEYDPFGNAVVDTDTIGQFKYRFSTKPLDAVTGLYYYGYRYYDPVTGRWPSRDPIEERGGVNLYTFLGNEGVNEVDQLGLCKVISVKKVFSGEIAGLDVPYLTTPHKDLAAKVAAVLSKKHASLNITVPVPTQVGTIQVNSSKGKIGNTDVPAGLFTAIHQFYFVEWEIDETAGECDLRTWERIAIKYEGDAKSKVVDVPPFTDNPQALTWVKAQKITQSGKCTTFIFADAPGSVAENPVPNFAPGKGFAMIVDQHLSMTGAGLSSVPVNVNTRIIYTNGKLRDAVSK